MKNNNTVHYIKGLINRSGMAGKLIAVNTVVFLFFLLIQGIEKFFEQTGLTNEVLGYFGAISSFSQVLYRPWTLISHFFTHYDFLHFFMNMLVLYFTSQFFVQFFGQRRLLSTYFLGGIFAYIIHVIAYSTFPSLLANSSNMLLLGASGSVMAIFFAVAVYRPSYKVNLFGVLPVPLLAIAAIYLVSDLMKIGSNDGVGHFAHLGGAIFGALSVVNANSPKNIMNRVDKFIFKFKFGKLSFKKKKPKMKVYTSTKTSKMTDEEYNVDKNARQAKINDILDKISKKGYEGLTKEEKDILFNESKRS